MEIELQSKHSQSITTVEGRSERQPQQMEERADETLVALDATGGAAAAAAAQAPGLHSPDAKSHNLSRASDRAAGFVLRQERVETLNAAGIQSLHDVFEEAATARR